MNAFSSIFSFLGSEVPTSSILFLSYFFLGTVEVPTSRLSTSQAPKQHALEHKQRLFCWRARQMNCSHLNCKLNQKGVWKEKHHTSDSVSILAKRFFGVHLRDICEFTGLCLLHTLHSNLYFPAELRCSYEQFLFGCVAVNWFCCSQAKSSPSRPNGHSFAQLNSG